MFLSLILCVVACNFNELYLVVIIETFYKSAILRNKVLLFDYPSARLESAELRMRPISCSLMRVPSKPLARVTFLFVAF